MPVIGNTWFPSRQQALVWLGREARRLVDAQRSPAQIAQQWRAAEVPTLLGTVWDSGAVQRCMTYGETIANQGAFPGSITLNLGG